MTLDDPTRYLTIDYKLNGPFADDRKAVDYPKC